MDEQVRPKMKNVKKYVCSISILFSCQSLTSQKFFVAVVEAECIATMQVTPLRRTLHLLINPIVGSETLLNKFILFLTRADTGVLLANKADATDMVIITRWPLVYNQTY